MESIQSTPPDAQTFRPAADRFNVRHTPYIFVTFGPVFLSSVTQIPCQTSLNRQKQVVKEPSREARPNLHK